MTVTAQYLLEKYGEIIKEEVNIKEVGLLPAGLHVSKQYAPIGKALSQEFGKDTGTIISAAKQGQIQELDDGRIRVFEGDRSRELLSHHYQVRYQGFDKRHQTVEDGVMVELDLTITDTLKKEGYAREMSRFLNQMRKDAAYNVDDRVQCAYFTEDDTLQEVVQTYLHYLQQEALLVTVQKSTVAPSGDISSVLDVEGKTVHFALVK